MKRLLYQIHRWVGVVLALFMFVWFSSGLVIMYAGPSALGNADRLAHAEALNPQAGWLSLGEALNAGAVQPRGIADARLVRQAQDPYWLVETVKGEHLALSALDGTRHETSAAEAMQIGARWLVDGRPGDPAPSGDTAVRYLDTGPQDSAVRNQEALSPFHRFTVGDSSRELLISARTGEVVRDSTNFTRALYWTGNWIHLLRPIEAISNAETRRNVLLWLGAFAATASLTGLIIGWLRWRPGWGGRATYSQGRVHPYRDVWNTWHFWVGLVGGIAVFTWAFSGTLSTNPLQVFSQANADREELRRYLGGQIPGEALAWRPAPLALDKDPRDTVELAWHHLGDEAVLLALTRSGARFAQPVPGTLTHFDDGTLLRAASRLAGQDANGSPTLLTDYDNYYYPRHRQNAVERPLPVVRVDLGDAAGTRLYLDPQDGQLLLKQDASRRSYRWLYSALHHWDFGWLYQRPVWDAWMLPLVLMGVVLGGTSLVLGWKRLRLEYETARKKSQKKRAVAAKAPKPMSTPAL